MANCYTIDIYEGKNVTFCEFAKRCARAFNAFITMRGEPLDAPFLDEFEPNTLWLDIAKQRLAEIKS